MKRLFFLAALVASATAYGQTSFCSSVSDVCCDQDYTSNTHQLHANDAFNWYYVDYDATTDNNEVTIKCEVDGFQIWEQTYCGCGRDSVYYPTANEHLLRVKVSCEVCPSFPGSCASGTALVKVYTPSTNNCRFDCNEQ